MGREAPRAGPGRDRRVSQVEKQGPFPPTLHVGC